MQRVTSAPARCRAFRPHTCLCSNPAFSLSFVLGSPDFTTVPTILYSYLGYNFIRPNAAVVSLILVVPNVLLMLIFERLLKSDGAVTVGGKG